MFDWVLNTSLRFPQMFHRKPFQIYFTKFLGKQEWRSHFLQMLQSRRPGDCNITVKGLCLKCSFWTGVLFLKVNSRKTIFGRCYRLIKSVKTRWRISAKVFCRLRFPTALTIFHKQLEHGSALNRGVFKNPLKYSWWSFLRKQLMALTR